MPKPGKLHHPIAVCTRYRVYSYKIVDANQPPFEEYNGKRCPGVFKSAVASGDSCQGSGWIFVRKDFP